MLFIQKPFVIVLVIDSSNHTTEHNVAADLVLAKSKLKH